MQRKHPTQERLRELLNYDPDTGVFTWKAGRRGVRPGHIAGTVGASGYAQICIDLQPLQAHRLAWIYLHGELAGQIDHINGIPTDNRAANLRVATPSQNTANRRKKPGTSSRLKGVTFKSEGKWQASIKADGRSYYLGLHPTEEAAHAAYCKAAAEKFGQFARTA